MHECHVFVVQFVTWPDLILNGSSSVYSIDKHRHVFSRTLRIWTISHISNIQNFFDLSVISNEPGVDWSLQTSFRISCTLDNCILCCETFSCECGILKAIWSPSRRFHKTRLLSIYEPTFYAVITTLYWKIFFRSLDREG
jgi:hypothetical protein